MQGQRQRGWWYPYLFIGFFLVVVAVNMTMAFFATSTFSGVATERPYEKGIAYNRNLAMAKAQAELGWTVEIRAGGAAGRAEIAASYRDRDGRAIDGLDVQALVTRPTTTGLERRAVLAQSGPGTYGAEVALPESGEWTVDVVATGKDAAYQMQRRFILP
jgi:nitrogen fixation protein FixH